MFDTYQFNELFIHLTTASACLKWKNQNIRVPYLHYMDLCGLNGMLATFFIIIDKALKKKALRNAS